MAKLVIADTSCLIVLSKIGRLPVLHLLYANITITPEIKQEFGDDLPEWVNGGVSKPKNCRIFRF